MHRDQESRKLMVVSLMMAFAIGAVFGALGVRLRPRVALAPDMPPSPNDTVLDVPPISVAAADVDPEVPMASDVEDGIPDSVPGDGTTQVPDGYPIKGNQRSGLYHVPGGLAYERTIANVLFRSIEAAEAAGYRASKA